MRRSLDEYMKIGAAVIRRVDLGSTFGRAMSYDRDAGKVTSKFDERYWRAAGRWVYNGKTRGGYVLKPKRGVDHWRAVEMIYNFPQRWRFDCSEFIQVVSFWAHLQVLRDLHGDARGRREFNRLTKGNLAIKPFEGSPFTMRKAWYIRASPKDRMTLRVNGETPGIPSCLDTRDVLEAAPVGSRVLWKNALPGAQGTAWNNENAMKVGRDRYIANIGHRERETKSIHQQGGLTEDQIIMSLTGKDLKTARAATWIKEIVYFSTIRGPLQACA